MLIRFISKVWRYIKFYISATSKRNVHSPFVYEFLENIVFNTNPYYIFKPLSSYRNFLSLNQTEISVEDFGAGSAYRNKNRIKVSSILRQSVKSEKYAELIFRIIQHSKPRIMLELGTSLGLTSIYMAKANKVGKIISIEGSKEIAEVAKKGFNKFNCNNLIQIVGNFDEELPKILSEYKQIDFAFIDGNHKESATVEYFDLLTKHIHKDSILIFDDIHWSSGMERAWHYIINHDSVSLSLDLFEMGIVFFFNRNQNEQHLIRF